jgi:hypothetical protein
MATIIFAPPGGSWSRATPGTGDHPRDTFTIPVRPTPRLPRPVFTPAPKGDTDHER